mgnify:CR=1 FL=1
MSKRAVLEVIALDIEDAVAAQAGGADRLELVTEMAADGLTPSAATVAGIRAAVDIDLRVMLRLADGFAAGDMARLLGVVEEMRAAGADQFVAGTALYSKSDMAAEIRLFRQLASDAVRASSHALS